MTLVARQSASAQKKSFLEKKDIEIDEPKK